MSISPTFYEKLFPTYGLGLYFWQKEIGAKAARKLFVKLSEGRMRDAQKKWFLLRQ